MASVIESDAWRPLKKGELLPLQRPMERRVVSHRMHWHPGGNCGRDSDDPAVPTTGLNKPFRQETPPRVTGIQNQKQPCHQNKHC
jgi:hypothetical protein